MTGTGHACNEPIRPAAPEMAAADPAMFAPLTTDENRILRDHLQSGWNGNQPSTPRCPNRGGKPTRSSTTSTTHGGSAFRPSANPRPGNDTQHLPPRTRRPARRGQCPGVDQRGHGLTMAVIHDTGCCGEWEPGQAATPDRAGAFRQAAARWGITWPQQRQHPPRAPNRRPSPRRNPDGADGPPGGTRPRTGAAPGNQPGQKASPISCTRWPDVSRSPEGAL